jgi:phosphoglycolate phosphatase
MQPTTIIWDWNGTLLNDLSHCIASINSLLGKRRLPLLDITSYKEVFSFPVKDYYTAIGFDFSKEDFSVPAHEFIEIYEAGVERCPLHPSAGNVLEYFRLKGCRQFVLSAMHQEMLERTLRHTNIYHYFEGVAGLADHYAVSKKERGQQLIKKFHIEKNRTWLVGDTNHDFEVALALGIKCILVADGHQSEERLKRTGAFVLNNLGDITNSYII